jgi:hypothetical protein
LGVSNSTKIPHNPLIFIGQRVFLLSQAASGNSIKFQRYVGLCVGLELELLTMTFPEALQASCVRQGASNNVFILGQVKNHIEASTPPVLT